MELRTALPASIALGCILGAVLAQDGFRAISLTESAGRPSLIQPAQEIVRWDLPVVWNESVARFVTLFETEQTDRMALYLKRSGRYEGMIRTKLRARGMPEDLIYLSMIESGFNPNARSRAQAVGLWQFMAPTARQYGLRVDSYVDERRDPEKSTDAALRYLDDLHGQFGAWNLAAAAYNTGGGRVARIMREETGAEKGVEADFWRIRDRLPSDTREYVPLMFAMALVGKEPQKYGLENVERWLPLPTDTVAVPGGTDLGTVAASVGIPEEDLKGLNPQLLRGVTPPGDDAYPLSIPDGRSSLFAANFSATTPPTPRPVARTADHRVGRGESLWMIARRHGITVASLRKANGLGSRSVIQPGQILKIPA